MDILYRPALPDDALGIAEVLHAQNVFDKLLQATPEETAIRTRTRLEASLPERDCVWVAISASRVVGYGAIRWMPNLIQTGPDAYLSELFIHPSCQGQRIGSRLLTELKGIALQKKCPRIWCINLRSRESYQRGYYRKAGWEEKDIAVFFDALDA